MKLIVAGPLKNNIYNLMRDAGYHFQREDSENSSTELSFVRPRHGFPRLHIYAKIVGSDLEINLHLDQKKPVYQGVSAHAGEYDGKVVESEIARLKTLFSDSESGY
jgi:hypothetical protein